MSESQSVKARKERRKERRPIGRKEMILKGEKWKEGRKCLPFKERILIGKIIEGMNEGKKED